MENRYEALAFIFGFTLGILFTAGTAYMAVGFIGKIREDLPTNTTQEIQLLPPAEKVGK